MSSSLEANIEPRPPFLICKIGESCQQRDEIFIRLLALKICFSNSLPHFIKALETENLSQRLISLLQILIPVGATFLVFKKRPMAFMAGLLIFIGQSLYLVVESFPYTINHHFLELAILLLYILLQPPHPSTPQQKSDLSLLRVNFLGILYLSVWVYSGLHKVFQGYFVSGEFLALYSLAGINNFGRNLQGMSGLLHQWFHSPALSIPACCNNIPLTMPEWEDLFYRVMGWMTLATELCLPILYLIPRTRLLGFLGIVIGQLCITLLSQEIDFGVTCMALLTLLAPPGGRKYLLLLSGIFYALYLYWALSPGVFS